MTIATFILGLLIILTAVYHFRKGNLRKDIMIEIVLWGLVVMFIDLIIGTGERILTALFL